VDFPLVILGRENKLVIAGLDPAIHPRQQDSFLRNRWMRGSSPRMTLGYKAGHDEVVCTAEPMRSQ
jgi:hypothetical protein